MSSTVKQGLIECRGLDATELSEIKHLAQLCNQYEGLDLKLNWSILSNHPYEEHKQLSTHEMERL